MSVFGRGLRVKRKTVVLFLLAIILPACLLGYLGFRTIGQRREAVRRILESNLAVSADAALRSIETALLEDERRALDPAVFLRALREENASPAAALRTDESGRKYFLLDERLQILWPRAGRGQIGSPAPASPLADGLFGSELRKAEALEYEKKDFEQAGAAYRRCLASPSSRDLLARALAGEGRCLLALKRYEEAGRVYRDLAVRGADILSEAGHPYGLTAALQLVEIRRLQGDEEGRRRFLLDAYRDLRHGRWPLSLATYRFFISEIEAAALEGRNPADRSDFPPEFQAIRGRPSPFEEGLIFAEFLEREVVLPVKEKLSLGRLGEGRSPGRLLTGSGDQSCLVSFIVLENLSPGRTFYGGYCWELKALAKYGLAKIAFPSEAASGLLIQVVDEGGRDARSGSPAVIPEGALTLSLRRYPLPWRFVFAQTGMGDLSRTAARENLFYALLLGVIGVLMVLGAFLLARDISRDAEATRLKTEFVQTISHELKTPLTLIRLYGETLQRQPALGDKERFGAYEIITKESERLSHLINNVLDFSRIEMGGKEFAFRKGSLADAVRATLESYRYHLEKKGFAVKAEIDSDLPEATFDPEALASVLVNLLGNAMKFSPGTKEVAVRLRRDGDWAVLEVEDKGLGIPPEEMGRIFQKFYRASSGAGSGATGSGLGLTIVKHIVEAHRGRVEVRSEPGKGSLFSVILPLQGPGEVGP